VLATKENEHHAALVELDAMRQNMDEMERERAQMVAEVEAQIERALASMAFSDGDNYSDYTHSRPGSAMSTASRESASGVGGHSGIGVGGTSIGGLSGLGGPALRHSESGPGLRQVGGRSASGHSAGSGSMSMQSTAESLDRSSRRLRSMATMTTLADDASDEATRVGVDLSVKVAEAKAGLIDEVKVAMPEEDPTLVVPFSNSGRRYSMSKHEGVDGFGAVDLGISERSDVVALRVQQIQQKVCNDRLGLFVALVLTSVD
jgi:nicotinamide N-methyltransferase